MRIARILKINFNRLSQPAFAKKASEINTAIHDADFSIYFPDFTPPGEAIAAALSAYQTALGKEQSKTIAALRKETRQILTNLLVKLALDLEEKADGDRFKLSHTGYDLNKIPGTRTTGSTLAPQNLRLKQGQRNQVIAQVDAIGGKTVYIGAFAYDPINGPWTNINLSTNSQKIIFNDLERARDVYIKVMADGPHGPSDWSDIATILVP